MIDLSMFSFAVIYLIIICAVFGGILSWGLYKLNTAKNTRLEAVADSEINEPVETTLNEENFEKISKKRASKSIESRFVFLRRFFIPVVLIFAGLFTVLPFVSTLSAAYVSIVAGAITVLVGIAARPFIENAIAGIVITLSQPIRINDTVIIDEMYGTVEKITLFYTTIKVWNWRRYQIPNNKFLQKEFENLTTGEETEWVNVAFHIDPTSDMEKVKKLATEAINNEYLYTTEEPSFWVTELHKDSIECWIAGWAEGPSYAWSLRALTRERLAVLLAKNGINFQLSRSHLQVKSL